MEEQTKKALSKYKGLGAAVAAKIMIGLWFGTGIILAIRIVDSFDCCVEVLMSSSSN